MANVSLRESDPTYMRYYIPASRTTDERTCSGLLSSRPDTGIMLCHQLILLRVDGSGESRNRTDLGQLVSQVEDCLV